MTTQHGSPDMAPLPKKHLHQLVDELPEDEIQAAEHCLRALCAHEHPIVRAMRSAPIDDEPVTDEDRKAIEEGDRDIAAGRGIPHEEVLRKHGL